MPKTIFKIKTWSCAICGYAQDFEPTQQNMNTHFNTNRSFSVHDIFNNECPSCALKGNRSNPLLREVNLSKRIILTIMGDEDIEDAIEQIKTRKVGGKQEKDDPDLSIISLEDAYRQKRRQDIFDAIQKAKQMEDNS